MLRRAKRLGYRVTIPEVNFLAEQRERHWYTPEDYERLVASAATFDVSSYAGVPQYGPHALRHSFGTRLMLNGAGVRVAMELLGHTNLATTQIYAHASKDHRRSAIDMLAPPKS